MPLGTLHCILAHEPSLDLCDVCGVREWDPGRVAADVWDTSKGYRPSQRAKMSEVGSSGGKMRTCEREWVSGGQRKRRGGRPPPRPQRKPPPRATTEPKCPAPLPPPRHTTTNPPPPKDQQQFLF